MKIEDLVLNFKCFMISSWPQLENIMGNLDWDDQPYFLDDWLQANWELIVERQLEIEGIVLPAYGYNQDTEARYTKVGFSETHKVVCNIAGVDKEKLFLKLVSKSDAGFSLEPPFDHVLVKGIGNKELEYYNIGDVKFSLVKL